ncbi:hypothetical protein GCM10015535_67210 [Streptomyces gelaticus]|uniref:Uncharacterized protein n=1 Tax=Streptomyces gelaticus TaxID=285446 RepID=A0ABQ2W8L3_9ACTN|nr:hypothetical protein GCM10015535_67210 [Streptomyces gelaticus]
MGPQPTHPFTLRDRAPRHRLGNRPLDLIHSPADMDRITTDTPDIVYACTTATLGSPTYSCAKPSPATCYAS